MDDLQDPEQTAYNIFYILTSFMKPCCYYNDITEDN